MASVCGSLRIIFVIAIYVLELNCGLRPPRWPLKSARELGSDTVTRNSRHQKKQKHTIETAKKPMFRIKKNYSQKPKQLILYLKTVFVIAVRSLILTKVLCNNNTTNLDNNKKLNTHHLVKKIPSHL